MNRPHIDNLKSYSVLFDQNARRFDATTCEGNGRRTSVPVPTAIRSRVGSHDIDRFAEFLFSDARIRERGGTVSQNSDRNEIAYPNGATSAIRRVIKTDPHSFKTGLEAH